MRGRPAIVQIHEDSVGEDASCTVILSYGNAEFRGSSIGDGAPSNRPRIVGEATLRAVEAVAEGGLRLELAGVGLTRMGNAVVALAQVRMEGERDSLVGSAFVQENDPTRATVKAVMDAINRRIVSILGGLPQTG